MPDPEAPAPAASSRDELRRSLRVIALLAMHGAVGDYTKALQKLRAIDSEVQRMWKQP